MKVALYARVSRGDLQSENQLLELRNFAARKGWEIAGEYVDEDVHGKDLRKPQQEAMLRDAHQGRFDVVAFWALDRLTRGGVEDAIVLLHRLGRMGVDFCSFREDAITSMVPGPVRDMVLSIYAALAEMETNRLSERTKAGLARARASGKRLGRPPRDYGSLTAADVTRMRTTGLSWAKIEENTGIPTGSLRRLAKIVSSASG